MHGTRVKGRKAKREATLDRFAHWRIQEPIGRQSRPGVLRAHEAAAERRIIADGEPIDGLADLIRRHVT